MYTHTHTHTLASGERSEAVYTCTQAYKFQGVNVTAPYKHQNYTLPPPVKPLSAHEVPKEQVTFELPQALAYSRLYDT